MVINKDALTKKPYLKLLFQKQLKESKIT
uniref:Uncharacterized protein n=1 Tax=Anguilla anguilla TaxID=7936 RepID=A0A0E9QLA3_ANGAN